MASLSTIEGVYRGGTVVLSEDPHVDDNTRVIVTFLSSNGKSRLLSDYGITPEEASEIRHGFGGGAADWDSPEMDVYDNL